ncbi:MAG: protein TolR [Arenicella sp.]
MSRYRNRRNKPMASINVVPYIDVMLVLLIIFMVTAPLLTEGVKVELPKTTSKPIDTPEDAPEPFLLTVDKDGNYYVNEEKKPKTPEEIKRYVKGLLLAKPNTIFLVKGDKNVIYNEVMQALNLLRESSVENVSLVTDPLN